MGLLATKMRQGSQQAPPARGGFYGDGGACALGAVLLADMPVEHLACLVAHHGALDYLDDKYPCLLEREVRCPACPDDPAMAPLFSVIVALNDDHRWTREAIADWLDRIGE